ncbi:MAG: substrate-binding domain-containing protein [Anaerolineales bacterium]|nr:substrate-binding domain-containing protein [Anaerolineales bacterium]
MKTIRIILTVLYTLAAIAVFIVALVSPAFRAVAYAPLRELILPPPEPITLHILYSTEKEAWLDQVLADFETQNPRVDGKPIEFTLTKMGSREIYLSVLEGAQPDVISPASALQIRLLEDLSEAEFGSSIVHASNQADCRSVVHTPLVLVTWAERADVLWGRDPGRNLWKDLQEAAVEPSGWGAYGRPEWGFIKFGHTNPLTSNSGFMTITLMTYDYFGISNGLTADDILSDEGYQEWFLDFENTVIDFGDSTGTYMRDIVAYGPSVYDVVAVYEATAIEQLENAAGRYGELAIYYPPQTIMSDHPFCILDAEWVTGEKRQASTLLIDYLTSPEAQQTAVMEHGFRPVDPSVPLDQSGSPFLREADNGVQIELPSEIDLPPGRVLDTLLNFWNRNITP